MPQRHLRLLVVAVMAALVGALFVAVPAHAAGQVVTGKVFGKLAGKSAKPEPNARVYLDRLNAEGFHDNAYRSGSTNAKGVFTIKDVPNGKYQVRIYPDTYGETGDLGYEYYKNKWSPYDSTYVTVKGSKVTLDNVVLEQPGWATGRITGPTAAEMADVSVMVQDSQNSGGYGFTVNSNGTFDTRKGDWTGNTIPGSYVISASYGGYDADDPVYTSPSRTVTISPNKATKVPDLVLKRRKTVVFTATDSSGRALKHAPVGLWIQDPKTGVYGSAQYGPIETDANGKFRLVEGRNYKIKFNPDDAAPAGDVAEYWDGPSGSGSYALQDATAITWPSSAPVKRTYSVKLGAAPALKVGDVKVKGTAKVGKSLKAQTTNWPGNARLRVQWEADGVPVKGATKKRLKLTHNVAKAAKIEARVTASRAGDKAVDQTSAPKVVKKRKLKAKKPTITGKAVVGKVLTAKPRAWKPKKVSFTYQWFRGKKAIKGATKKKHKVTKADRGKKLKVRVTGTLGGYTTTQKTSGKTAKVRKR